LDASLVARHFALEDCDGGNGYNVIRIRVDDSNNALETRLLQVIIIL